MRATRYRVFVIFLALALSGNLVARAMHAGEPCTLAAGQAVAPHADCADQQPLDDSEKQRAKVSAAACWGMCVVAATGILTWPSDGADLIASSVVVYAVDNQSLDGRLILLDPGIPKHFS